MLFSTKLKAKIEELTAACAAEKERADKAAAALAAKDEEIAGITAKLKAAEEENGRLDIELGAKEADVAAAQKELAGVKKELEATKAELAARTEDVKRAFAAELAAGKTKEAQDAAGEGHPAPLPESGAESGAETWADALKAEGGDYAKARKLHPAAYAAAFPALGRKI